MVLLKELQSNGRFGGDVTVHLDADDVCNLHNGLCLLAKQDERYEEMALAFTNIYEMLHHGHLTDFGIYKNAKYFKRHDDFSKWGNDENG